MSARQRTRARRPSEEVRALLLDKARELFLANGYEATTTKEICLRAGVVEPLLFSNFGSKAALFDAAVIAPISDFVSDYVASWQQVPDLAPDERVDRFVSGLFDLAKKNRTVLLAAVMQRTNNGPREGGDVLDHLARTLQGVREVADLDEYHDVDPPAVAAAAAGMVLGVALLDDLLFPSGSRRPSRSRLSAEMSKLILYGTTRRPDPGDGVT